MCKHSGWIVIVLVLAACGGGGDGGNQEQSPPADDSYLLAPAGSRDWLTGAQLFADDAPPDGPLNEGWFVGVGMTGPPLHSFSGTLHLTNLALRSNGPATFDGRNLRFFPDVDLRFVSDSDVLVPLDRDILGPPNGSTYWRLVLGPGRVWSESGDDGYSRAAFPFALVHKERGEVHNGIATFLYDDATVSRLRLQVTQETAAWARNDYWAQLPMSYAPQSFPEEASVLAEHAQEVADAWPIHAWSELEQATATSLDGFDDGVGHTDVSASAIVWNGALYLNTCTTRYGDYPFCGAMPQGAFSVTKSAAAALALLRLAQKYGPEVLDERIETWVNVTATHMGWSGVTLRDALDMAVGVGDNDPVPDSGDIFADENQAKMEDFQLTDTAAGKLAAAFSYGNYPWGPGTEFRYNSTHTFVLGAAMDAYLKSREGPDADIGDLLRDEVYAPIGIHHLPLVRTIEASGARGLPEFFVGLYPTVDDMAKITTLLQRDGSYGGVQILDAELTRAMLYRTGDRGLHAWWWDGPGGDTRYLLSSWSFPYDDGAGCRRDVPVMSGYGGDIVALLPNGASAFRFADAQNYYPGPVIDVAARLGSLCSP